MRVIEHMDDVNMGVDQSRQGEFAAAVDSFGIRGDIAGIVSLRHSEDLRSANDDRSLGQHFFGLRIE